MAYLLAFFVAGALGVSAPASQTDSVHPPVAVAKTETATAVHVFYAAELKGTVVC